MSHEKYTLSALYRPPGETPWQTLGNIVAVDIANEFEPVSTTRSEGGVHYVNDVQIDTATFGWRIDGNESNAQTEKTLNLSSLEQVTQAAETGLEVEIANTVQGGIYPLGKLNVSNVSVTGYDPVDDYVVFEEEGEILIVEGGAITNGSAITVTFDCAAMSLQSQTTNQQALWRGEFRLNYYQQTPNLELARVDTFDGVIVCHQFPEQTGEFASRTFFILATGDIESRVQVPFVGRVCLPGEIVEDWEDYPLGSITAPNVGCGFSEEGAIVAQTGRVCDVGDIVQDYENESLGDISATDDGCGFESEGVINSNYASTVATEDYEAEPLGAVTTTSGGSGFNDTGAIGSNSF